MEDILPLMMTGKYRLTLCILETSKLVLQMANSDSSGSTLFAKTKKNLHRKKYDI